ncbi:MAG: aspartyl/asparaginyl beta-hydroxylase domain-containing protein [Alphaproteobacteria bacterium]|nr:MAG: aspartyl/asparaginyl beta-hydroxylase domain-containing protein [Alphaproteobacteria bacterium]
MGDYIAQPFAAKFPDRLRLPFRFDPALLARDLARLSSATWVRHYVRQNYDGDWSVIALRAPAGETHPIRMINADPTCKSFIDTPLLDACPYFREVLASFKAPLRNARLMRLSAGSVIKEHEDLDLSFEDGKVRLHIPVLTNDDVAFLLNRSRVPLEAGSCWYLRLSDPHSVANRGTEDRVHLVIDADVNAWVGEVFEQAVGGASISPSAHASPMMS